MRSLRSSRALQTRLAAVSNKACQTSSILHGAGRSSYATGSSRPAQDDAPNSSPLGNNKGAASSTTHFGFRDVPEQLKESLVGGVFSSVASSYDVMNDVMSFGIHRVWKDRFVRRLDPGSRGSFSPQQILDVAGGTGDIAFRHLDHATDVNHDHETSVHVVDINADMLAQGMVRARSTRYADADSGERVQVDARGLPIPGGQTLPDGSISSGVVGPRLRFSVGNAESLPAIASNSIDIYTIAFGIRNVTHIDRVLSEAYRVLKPGGVFSCLEFSSVRPVAPLTDHSYAAAHAEPNYATSSFYGGADVAASAAHPHTPDAAPSSSSSSSSSSSFSTSARSSIGAAAKAPRHRPERISGPFDALRSAFSRVYEGYSFSVIPLMGELVASDRQSYQYLVESIARFPDQEAFSGMIRDAGFVWPGSTAAAAAAQETGSLEGKAYENLSLGIAAIHTGIKPRS